MSYASFIKSFPEKLFQPTGIAVMASVGIHALLGLALPYLPLASQEKPKSRRSVQLVQLTPTEQSRLPQLSPSPLPPLSDPLAPLGSASLGSSSLPSLSSPFPPPPSKNSPLYNFPVNPLPLGGKLSTQSRPRITSQQLARITSQELARRRREILKRPVVDSPRHQQSSERRQREVLPSGLKPTPPENIALNPDLRAEPSDAATQTTKPSETDSQRREPSDAATQATKPSETNSQRREPSDAATQATKPSETNSQRREQSDAANQTTNTSPPRQTDQRTATNSRPTQEQGDSPSTDSNNTTDDEARKNYVNWLLSMNQAETQERNITGSYPKDACSQKLEGTTVVGVLVGADGRVAQLQLLKSSRYPVLNQQAQEDIKSRRFENTTGSPKPYRVSVKFEYNPQTCVSQTVPENSSERQNTPEPQNSSERQNSPEPQDSAKPQNSSEQ